MSLKVAALAALLCAAALAVPIVVALVADDAPDIEILDAAPLESPDGNGAGGRVELITVDGQPELKVDLAETTVPAGTFLEVWLVETDRAVADAPGQSLGPVRDQGRNVLPTGVDLDRFATVLVTAEPLDGDPVRSGDVVYAATFDVTTPR
ncbi:MAG: anti-sigma factor [Acidimicrobiales bacterium]